MANLLNKYTMPKGTKGLYIGRGSIWGNPHVIGIHGTRKEVIAKYRTELWEKIHQGRVSLTELADLQGKELICFCTPLPCHGDVLIEAARWARQVLDASCGCNLPECKECADEELANDLLGKSAQIESESFLLPTK